MARSQVQYGSQGGDVKELQTLLNKTGYNLATDGIFGAATQAAVKNYQQKNGLAVDGIVGKNTWASLGIGTVGAATGAVGGAVAGATGANKSTSIAAPTADPLPGAPSYDSTSWGDTDKGKDAWDAYNDAKAAVNGHGDFKYANQAQLDAVMNSILNGGKFSYDFNEDALYHMYKDKYIKQGKMAMADTMGQAAAMTGGYGNSYAATVGNQAYQASLEQLNDVIPELYQMAWDQYAQERQDLYNQYGMLADDYERGYGQHQDKYNKLLDSLGIARDDYYDGADMFYTEQNNRNSIASQIFNDAMSLWTKKNDNAWKTAQWEEEARQRAEDIAYQRERDAVADEQWQKEFDSKYGSTGTGSDTTTGGDNVIYAPPGKYLNGYDNGSLSEDQVKEIQKALGITADGKWGSDSRQATDGMTAEEAWNAYKSGKIGKQPEKPTIASIEKDLNTYIKNGASRSNISAYLRSAWQDGYITESQYKKLKEIYVPQSSSGGVGGHYTY